MPLGQYLFHYLYNGTVTLNIEASICVFILILEYIAAIRLVTLQLE